MAGNIFTDSPPTVHTPIGYHPDMVSDIPLESRRGLFAAP